MLTKQIKRLVDIDAQWVLVNELLEYGTLDEVLYGGINKRGINDDHGGRRTTRSRSSSSRREERGPSWSSRLQWSLDIAEAIVFLRHHGFTHGNIRSTSCYLFPTNEGNDFMDEHHEDGESKSTGRSNDEWRQKRRRFRIKVGDMSLERHISVPMSSRSLLHRRSSGLMFNVGDDVKVVKSGTQEGKMATVVYVRFVWRAFRSFVGLMYLSIARISNTRRHSTSSQRTELERSDQGKNASMWKCQELSTA